MFGFKTKKDKRIEDLEQQLRSIYFKHPQIITTHGNVIALAAKQTLEDGIPVEIAKYQISKKLVDEAIKFIHYDAEQWDMKHVLVGYIQVVANGKEVK